MSLKKRRFLKREAPFFLAWFWAWFWVYIRCCGNGGLCFRSYSGSLLKSAKVSKTLLPHHSAPRLGSVCPHSGITPWAAAKGHPWPSAAIPASMPGCPLRNACVRPAWLTGRRDQRPPRGGLIADLVLGGTVFLLWERACSRRRWISYMDVRLAALIASKLAPTGFCVVC